MLNTADIKNDFRKVTFYIDDLEFFHNFYHLTNEQMKDLFDNQHSFKVIYTLYGFEDGNLPDRYTLTDYDGNKIDYNTLNGYQRGVVLNDCWAYYTGGKYHCDSSSPCGIVKIEDETGTLKVENYDN